MITKVSIVIPYACNKEYLSLYVQLRQESGELNNKYEFPGGKIEVNESPIEAAAREFREEVGVVLDIDKITFFSLHQYEYQDRNILFYIYTVKQEDCADCISKLSEQKISWESLENDVKKGNYPQANKEFLLVFGQFIKKQMGLFNE